MIYLVVFGISMVCYGFGVKSKSSFARHIFLGLSVFILALLAGFRDYTVGTDVRVYGLPVFNLASEPKSIIEFVTNYSMSIEPGYALIAYLSSRFSSSPHFFFFIVGLINYTLIAAAIYNNRESISPTMSWCLYLFLYFSDSLSIMRQSIALAIVFYGIQYIQRNDIKRSIIAIAIGVIFHRSAIIAVLVYGIYYFCRGRRFANGLRLTGYMCLLTFATLIFPRVFEILVNSGVLPEIYSRYLNGEALGIAVKPVLIRFVPILIVCVFWGRYKKSKNAEFLVIMLIADMILCNLVKVNPTFERIGLFFGYYRVFAYSQLLVPQVMKLKHNRYILTAFFLAYAIVLFVYQIVIMGGNQVVPYTSALLGIGY